MAEKPVMPRPDPRKNRIAEIAAAAAEVGGRALYVGGCVRDQAMGRPIRDLDVELLGLSIEAAQALLDQFGATFRMGQSYTVLRLRDLDVDFTADDQHGLDFAAAATRRDLTLNSMAIDPITDEWLDPFQGRADIAARRLRATDPATFGQDPLRAMRVARFAACLELEPDERLRALCADQPLESVAGERLFAEWSRLLAEAPRPSVGLQVLKDCGQLRSAPELAALVGVEQDPTWHPEGDVWTHTLQVIDVAARIKPGTDDDLAFMWATLGHDLGKAESTRKEAGRVHARGHEHTGRLAAEAWLERLRAPRSFTQCVGALIEHHLAPALLPRQGASPRAYRRLARKLDEAGTSMALLERVARADHLGRTTPEAIAGRFAEGDIFLAEAKKLQIQERGPVDLVHGRDVIARGISPGPEVGRILEACREIQDAEGVSDPKAILDAVLGALAALGD